MQQILKGFLTGIYRPLPKEPNRICYWEPLIIFDFGGETDWNPGGLLKAKGDTHDNTP